MNNLLFVGMLVFHPRQVYEFLIFSIFALANPYTSASANGYFDFLFASNRIGSKNIFKLGESEAAGYLSGNRRERNRVGCSR